MDCCNIQDGALCGTIITKRSILDVTAVLDPLVLELALCLLDSCYQSSFLRQFLVPRMFIKLNMNGDKGKIKLVMKKTFKL